MAGRPIPTEPEDASALPISLRGVEMVYQTNNDEPTRALESVNLDIAAGEFVSLVGPSGCGKSTLLQLVAGLIAPTSGRIEIAGNEVTGAIDNLGFVFQDAVLLEWRRALDNVMLQAEMRGDRSSKTLERAHDLLRMVGLERFESRYPHELSGGMRQRVSICRALLHNPPLLLMDEPFGALDALTRDQLTVDLQDIWLTSRKTVLFVTHNVNEAVFLSDRILVMSARPGRIVADITVDLPRPRTLAMHEDPTFMALSRRVYDIFASIGVLHDTRQAAK
jgi:NitT/TauT family transport system ATP-binding protein